MKRSCPVTQFPGGAVRVPAPRRRRQDGAAGKPGSRAARRGPWWLAIAVIAATALNAQTTEDKELAELLSVIEQETEIATKSRMNSDYVPGIVTVLEGEELEALGFDTVWEALAMVPGVMTVRDSSGTGSVIVRGIQFPFNSGNIKILVDGVSLSRESSGINGSTLSLPIQLVERIEFIRGPGSVIYGDFAFMGLVNIITKKGTSRAYARADSDGVLTGGARAAVGGETSPWQLTASVAAFNDDDVATAIRTGHEERHWAVASLRHAGFTLSGQLVQRDVAETTRPIPPGPGLSFDETSWAVQARYERALSEKLHGNAAASLLDSGLSSRGDSYNDRVARVSADVQWDGWARQSWFAGVEALKQEIENARHPQPAPPGAPPSFITISDERRDVYSLALQDRIDFNDRFSVTAGARFDDYSDVGHRLTPRLSLVWRASDRHILKAQYAEGFRAPTFFEEFGGGRLNESLDFEVNATTELNYVFRRPRTVARATIFHSDLKDMVFGGLPGGRFGNTRAASADGVELEWSQQISEKIKLLANVAYVDAEENRGPTTVFHASEAAAEWMSDLALLFRPIAQTVLTLHWNHAGQREVVEGDAWNVLDLTATRFIRSFVVRGGVKNALGDEVLYLGVRPTGQIDTTRFNGRTWWVQFGWR